MASIRKRRGKTVGDDNIPFPPIDISSDKQSTTSSLSTRARHLGRRLSSLRLTGSPLCACCRSFDFQRISDASQNPDGVALGWVPDNPITNKCPLCQILPQIRIKADQALRPGGSAPQSQNPFSAGLQLRAFPLLPYLVTSQSHGVGAKLESCSSDFFLGVVPSDVSILSQETNRARIGEMVSKDGFLIYCDEKTSSKRALSPRLITPSYDPALVKAWLESCQTHHSSCRSNEACEASVNLIDCHSGMILSSLEIDNHSEPEYVALSYVWGNNTEVSDIVCDGHTLPPILPTVVKDSMQVVLALGYRYLWVDKYCVDNQDKTKKHEQLMHMGSVYKNAALTIVAAAGTDETYGLPGVSRKRATRQLSFNGGSYTLTSTLPRPHQAITSSCWATRGWTYQEAILSRRRLVFTDDQLYFECSSMNCCESFDMSLGSKTQAPSHGIQPFLFSLKQLTTVEVSVKDARLSNLFTYMHCAEQYSRRTLSFDHDSLAAFSGIIRMLESFTAFPVRHTWGVPFFHPDDDHRPDARSQSLCKSFRASPYWKSSVVGYRYSTEKGSVEVEGADYLAFLMLGLSWRHDTASSPPRRRNQFPSWSWTGWEGSVIWPKLSENSSIEIFPWTETAASFGDITTEPALEIPDKTLSASASHSHSFESNKSLYMRTLAISRTAFVLNEPSDMILLSTGSRVKLYPSKPDLDTRKIFDRIQSARYEAIPLATVGETTYMMLVKRYRNSYYRIGTMSVNAHYLTVPLFTSKIKTYKLR